MFPFLGWGGGGVEGFRFGVEGFRLRVEDLGL